MLSSATPTNPSFITFDKDRIRDVNYIRELIEKKILFPNSRLASSMPILAFALQHEAFETVKYLLELNADLNATDNEDNSCIERLLDTSPEFFSACFDLALEREYWPIIALYITCVTPGEKLERHILSFMPFEQNLLTEDEKLKEMLLFIAIKRQHPKAVKFLLEHNVSSNVTCEGFGTPLRVAIMNLEYPSDASWLIKESPNYQANNPVMYEIIELLLKHKADPGGLNLIHVTYEIYSPLTYSVYQHDTKLMRLLLAHNPYAADLPAKEALSQFLCDVDANDIAPMTVVYANKSRKMYHFLLEQCPDLVLKNIDAFGEFYHRGGDYSTFMNEILNSMPFEQRKLLFQPYTSSRGEAGDGALNASMRRLSWTMTSSLLKQGANLPIVTSKNGNKKLSSLTQRTLAIPKWNEKLSEYLKDLKAAEVTPMLRDLAANVIYDYTHQNKSVTNQLKGYLPLELFELYQSTPQRREKRIVNFKPVIRECLENALSVNKDVDENETKKAKTSP